MRKFLLIFVLTFNSYAGENRSKPKTLIEATKSYHSLYLNEEISKNEMLFLMKGSIDLLKAHSFTDPVLQKSIKKFERWHSMTTDTRLTIEEYLWLLESEKAVLNIEKIKLDSLVR